MTKPEKVSCENPKEIHAQNRKSGLTKHILMRPSRSDPVVRVYSEAPTEGERDRLLDASCGMVRAGA